jgi:hypothetical protein
MTKEETVATLEQAGKEFQELAWRACTLLDMIRDAYLRMATNTDPVYRLTQRAKADEWLAELTKIYEEKPQLRLWSA